MTAGAARAAEMKPILSREYHRQMNLFLSRLDEAAAALVPGR